MLKLKPIIYNHCPFCGLKTTETEIEDKHYRHCPKCDWTHFPSVYQSSCGVIQNRNKVIMVKRNRRPFYGTWQFPGGFVSYGEHPRETIIREIEEETGLKVENPKLMDVFQSTDDDRAPGHLVFFYKFDTSGKVSNKDNEENSEVAWIDINSKPKISWSLHKEMFAYLTQVSHLVVV